MVKARPGEGEGGGEQCAVINTDRPLTRPHGNQPMCLHAGGPRLSSILFKWERAYSPPLLTLALITKLRSVIEGKKYEPWP